MMTAQSHGVGGRGRLWRVAFDVFILIVCIGSLARIASRTESWATVLIALLSGIVASATFDLFRELLYFLHDYLLRIRTARFFGSDIMQGAFSIAVPRFPVQGSLLGQFTMDADDGIGAARLAYAVSRLSGRTVAITSADKMDTTSNQSCICVGLNTNQLTRMILSGGAGETVSVSSEMPHQVTLRRIETSPSHEKWPWFPWRVRIVHKSRNKETNVAPQMSIEGGYTHDIAIVVRHIPLEYSGRRQFICAGTSFHGTFSACMFLADRWREMNDRLVDDYGDMWVNTPGTACAVLRMHVDARDASKILHISWIPHNQPS